MAEEDSLALELSSGDYSFTVSGNRPEERKWAESGGGGLSTCTVDWASYGDSAARFPSVLSSLENRNARMDISLSHTLATRDHELYSTFAIYIES